MKVERRFTSAGSDPYVETSATPARSSTASPAAGPTGAESTATSTRRGGRAGLLRRAVLHAGQPDGRAQLAAVVQHRAELGLRHHRPGPGTTGTAIPRPASSSWRRRLRAPAAARLLHPVRGRRPGERRRHHGPVDPRGAAVQVRLGHGHQLLPAARRGRAAVRRRQEQRPDELSQDRRPRRRRDQERRDHPSGGQDGLPRPRPPRHRDFVNWKVREEQGRGTGHRFVASRRSLAAIARKLLRRGATHRTSAARTEAARGGGTARRRGT
jgi:hypothetical protein